MLFPRCDTIQQDFIFCISPSKGDVEMKQKIMTINDLNLTLREGCKDPALPNLLTGQLDGEPT